MFVMGILQDHQRKQKRTKEQTWEPLKCMASREREKTPKSKAINQSRQKKMHHFFSPPPPSVLATTNQTITVCAGNNPTITNSQSTNLVHWGNENGRGVGVGRKRSPKSNSEGISSAAVKTLIGFKWLVSKVFAARFFYISSFFCCCEFRLLFNISSSIARKQ